MDWYKEVFDEDSDTLVIALHSFWEDDDDPNKWEWWRSTQDISKIAPFKKLFIKHAEQSWWQTKFEGVEGYGPHALAKFINEEIKKSSAKRTIIMGMSMGGYGAILFGCLCKADLAIAISPQTYLTQARYKKSGLEKKFTGFDVNREETDLKVILERYNNHFTQYNVYYGRYELNDVAAAERISHFENVKLFPIESSKHTVAKPMIALGIFQKVLIDFITKGIK